MSVDILVGDGWVKLLCKCTYIHVSLCQQNTYTLIWLLIREVCICMVCMCVYVYMVKSLGNLSSLLCGMHIRNYSAWNLSYIELIRKCTILPYVYIQWNPLSLSLSLYQDTSELRTPL